MNGNVIVGQSGGPTSVINSSLVGVFKVLSVPAAVRFTVCETVLRDFCRRDMSNLTTVLKRS